MTPNPDASHHHPDPADAPKSAARLAADAAFALPDEPLPAATAAPLVIVRRARLPALAVVSAAADSAPPADCEPEDKGPRVFRVAAVPAVPALPTFRDDGQPEPGPEPVAADQPAAAPPGARVPRKQRIAVDKRPGPTLQVFQAPTRPVVAETAVDSRLRPQALREALADLDPVFDAIRRAQSLRLIDDGCVIEWQRLTRLANSIQREIETQLAG